MTTIEYDGSIPPRFGDRGDGVRRLQATLRLLGTPVPEEESARGTFGEGTAGALRGWQESVRLEPSGLLDEQTDERARAVLTEQPRRIVLGRVTTPDGRPIEGLAVRAFDANLAGERPIAGGDGAATAVTDAEGRYELVYSTDELGRAGKRGADLVVRAYRDDAGADPAASSAVVYAAGPVEFVPLVVGTAAPSSSYELLLDQITPALDGRSVGAVDLASDLEYLAGTTGVSQPELSSLARAAGLAAEADRLVEADPAGEAATAAARSVPAFYALVRGDPAADLGTVLGTPRAELAGRVAEAARDGLIPVDVDPEAVAGAVVDLQARRILRPGAPGEPPSIGDVLRTIPAERRLDDASALAVSRLLAEEGGPSDAFWRRLPETRLGDGQIRDVRLAITLNDVAAGDLRLVDALQAETPDTHDGTATHLAALGPNRWMEIVAGAAEPADDDGEVDPAIVPAVAAELAERVERLHPSTAFRAKLEAGLLGQTGFPAARVAGFLGDHPDFDLVDTTVEPYLDDAGLADDELRRGLLAAQRMLRIGAGQDDLEILFAAGLGSTADLALRDRQDLIAQLRDSIPEDRLGVMHERAQYMLAGALGAATVFSPRYIEPVPPPAGPATAPSAPPGFPSIGQLFGDRSACRCTHCRSVLGPSAYLVDLLHLLDKTGFDGQLQARRPDIAELELTCENANTTLPYVDLVLEILEAAAAFPTGDVALTPAEATQLEGGTVPAPLRTELAKHAADEIGPLGVEVATTQLLIFPPSRRIVVRDRKRRWPGRLWRRQMTIRWPTVGVIPATASVPDADIAATRQALAAGQAPANLVGLIAPEPEAPVVGVPTVTASAPPRDQDEHTVVLLRSMSVELVGTFNVGAIRFLTTGGALISAVQVQNVLIPIAQQLASGKVHPYLANLLPPLRFTVTQEQTPAGALGRWTLSATVTATVRFTPDRVVVQGLTYGSSDRTDDALFPENRDPEAYRILNSALYPLDLPFDLFREEVRACLAIAGSSRLELLRTLLPSRRYASVDEACEALDAAPAQLAVITEAAGTAARVASLWGLQENGNTLADPLDATAPPVPADWVGALSRASVLVDRSGVELPTLQAMFASRYLAEVAPDIHLEPSYECRLSRITVVGLNRQSLDRLQRLLRLRRITGWPVRDTDLALLALTRAASPPTGNAAVRALGHVQELVDRTHASVRTVAAWLGAVETTAFVDLETDGEPARPSLYDEAFADPRQRGPDSAEFALDANGGELAYITDQGANPTYVALSDRLAYAAAALRLRPAELAELIGTGPLGVVTDQLSLANLCTLLRQTSLARAAGISVRRSRILQELTGGEPLPVQPPAVDEAGRRILEFLDAVDTVRSSGFTAEELAWCLEGAEIDGTARAERRLGQLRWLVDLQAALREIQPASGNEVADTALRALLRSAGWPDSLVDRVVEGEGNELGLGSRPSLEVGVAAAQPPALPAGGPFALTAAEPGRYVLGLSRPPIAADFTALAQVAGLGPLANATSPATRLRDLWDDLSANTGVLTRWLQSVGLPRLSRPLRFTVPAPRDGATTRAEPATGLGSAIRVTAAGELEIDGFLTAGDARRLRTWATGATNEGDVRAAIATLVGVPPALGVAGAQLVYEPVLRTLTLVGYPAAADVPALAGIVDNADYAATVQALVAAADAYVEQRPGRLLLDADAVLRLFVERTAPQLRFAAVQDALVGPLRRQRAGELVGARTGIDRRLLDALDAAAESAAQPVDLLGDLASEELLGVSIRDVRAEEALADSLAALDRWDRAGLLVRRLGVLPAEAAWLSGTSGFGGLDPLGLAPAGPGDAYKRWRDALTLYELRGIVPGAGATLERVRTAASVAAGIEVLAGAFDVAAADVTALLALDSPVGQLAELRNPAVLRRVVDACRTLRRLRAPADALVPLCAQLHDQPAAAAARGLVLVRPDALAAAPGSVAAAGRLRDRQRAALVAYLVDRDGARDASDLHSRYLLDVEMGPTLRTSRTKQAISSTQLFMQRLLLNLEGGSPAQLATLARQAAWAGSQQIWESNRSVFLYPQNWLEPSLREGKSHLFRKLEGELLQGELTTERAISLFGDYLVALQDIAQVTVRAMYEEALTTTSSVVHVLARTPDQPLRFFYRQWLLAETSRQWTPWEAVESVTNTEHAVCYVRGRRPYIAWLQIGRAVDVLAGPTADTAAWEVELLWCFRTNDGWSAPQKWRSRLRHPVLVNKDERTSFALRVHDHLGMPQLRVYGARELGATQQAVTPVQEGTRMTFNDRAPTATFMTQKIDVQVVGELEATTGTAYFGMNDARVELWGWWSIKYDIGGTQGRNTPPWPTASAPQLLTIQNGGGSARWTVPLEVHQIQAGGVVATYPVIEATAKVYIRVTVAGVAETFPPITLDPTKDNVVRHGVRYKISPNDPRFLASRPVRLVHLASFDWDNSIGVRGGPPGDGSELAPEIPTTIHESSGLREGPTDAALVLDGRTLTQATSLDRFFVVGSAGTNRIRLGAPVYVEEEGAGAFLVRRKVDDTWALLPSSEYVAGDALAAITSGGETLDLGAQDTSTRVRVMLTQVAPAAGVSVDHAATDAQFALPNPASAYDWEVYFHVPYLIATVLANQQRYAEALRWLHLIFDPTLAGSQPAAAWRFRPFRTESSPGIDRLLVEYARGTLDTAARDAFQAQIDFWREHPFRPHGIARLRLRAYQWMVIYKYVEIRIAWGDLLFRRDTLESMNAATQQYLLAAQLLGTRPPRLPEQPPLISPLTYAALADRWDDFSNAWISLADLPLFKAWLAFLQWLAEHGVVGPNGSSDLSDTLHRLQSTGLLVFCVPPNDRTETYRATVADRLTKIRSSQTIDGVTRQPALYEPAIDPALLVRAVAAGLDLDTVLSDISAPTPRRRFSAALQRANDFVGEVRSLGAAVLSALEKRDAEELARLRAVDERALLELMTTTRRRELDEANAAVEAARQAREGALTRYVHYQRLLGKQRITLPEEHEVLATEPTRLQLAGSAVNQLDPALQGYGLTIEEVEQLSWLTVGNTLSLVGGGFQVASGIAHMVPNFTTSWFGQEVQFGGSNVGSGLGAVGQFFSMLANNASFQGTRSSIVGGHQRRYDDWVLQSNIAAQDIEQSDRQLLVAEIRLDIARRTVESHLGQVESARRTEEFLRRKFTNQELYQWMCERLGQAHSTAFQLAYELAKTAERALARDLGTPSPGVIRFGTWENTRQGLLAGELLAVDLKRLEAAYLHGDERELEITKHVALSELAPLELLRLRQTGTCEFEVPETAYDMDFAGHYFRRLRSVSVSVPCTLGPYRSPAGTLTLVSSRTRISAAPRPYAQAQDDPRFVVELGGVQSIATSSGQNDSGLFELDFRDERYLPFERFGAISRWRFELPSDFRPFDYRTISDLILHVRYTARDGGRPLGDAATANLRALLAAAAQTGDLVRTISMRRQRPSEWHRLAAEPGTPQEVSIDESELPYALRDAALGIWKIAVFVQHTGAAEDPARIAVRCPQIDQDGVVELTELELQLDDTVPIEGLTRYDADLLDAGLDPVAVTPPGPATMWQLELEPGTAYDDVVLAFWCAAPAV
jgi:hypothetical protein